MLEQIQTQKVGERIIQQERLAVVGEECNSLDTAALQAGTGNLLFPDVVPLAGLWR
ncbi:MAG: hypothetical protein WCP58_09450 [bacterium]